MKIDKTTRIISIAAILISLLALLVVILDINDFKMNLSFLKDKPSPEAHLFLVAIAFVIIISGIYLAIYLFRGKHLKD